MFEYIYDGYLRHKRQYRIYIICTTVSLLMLSICFAVIIGCDRLINNELEKEYTYREADITVITGKAEELLNRDEWKSYIENGQISSVQIMQSVSVGGEDFAFRFCDEQTIRTFQTETITGLDSDYSTFSQAKVDYLQNETKGFKKMIAGREFQSGDKSAVIVSERTAFELGFLNPDEIIGQKLEMDIGEKILDIKIIGVAAAQLCDENIITEIERQRLSALPEIGKAEFLPDMEDNRVGEGSFLMKGYFSADVIEEIENYRKDAEDIRTVIHISVDRAKNTLGIIQDINQMMGNEFFLSGNLLSLFSIMETIKKATNIMILLSAILVLLTLLNLYCVLYMVSDKQKKSFALKNILGFSKKKICNMYCMEIWIATGIASFFSFIFGFFVCKSADMIVMNAYKSRIHMQNGLITFPFMIFVPFVCLFFAAGWCIAYRHVKVILNEASIEILEK